MTPMSPREDQGKGVPKSADSVNNTSLARLPQ